MMIPAEPTGLTNTKDVLSLRITIILILLATFGPSAYGGDPVDVVILPPVTSPAEKNVSSAANVFCDRLAAELAKDPGLRSR